MRYPLLTLLLVAAGVAVARGEGPPNVVLILADDVGREVLGCYGGQSYPTPRIDRLADEGMRLEHCYVMPSCHPTRVSLLTGLYPHHLGNPKWGEFPVEFERQTVAHRLKQAGYATAIAGKWQLAMLGRDLEHPQRLGFDESCLFGWHEGPRYFQPLIWQNGERREDVQDRYGPEVYCDFLIDFIGRNRERPFFAYYSMALCHDVTDDLPAPVPLGPAGRYESYAEMVASMDRQVGRLLDAIDRLALRQRTLVLFLADNGTPSQYIAGVEDGKLVRQKFTSTWRGQEVRGGKTQLTDLGIRVPGLIRWPGKVAAQSVTESLFDVSDVLPTLTQAAGGDWRGAAAPRIDGRPFSPLFDAEGNPPREWVFAQRGGAGCVRTARWKLYSSGQLFDMLADPLERQPVAEELDARSELTQAFQQLKFPHQTRAAR